MFGTTSFAPRPNRRESIHVFQQDMEAENTHFSCSAPDFTLSTLVCGAYLRLQCPFLLARSLSIGRVALSDGCYELDLKLLEFDLLDSWLLGHDFHGAGG